MTAPVPADRPSRSRRILLAVLLLVVAWALLGGLAVLLRRGSIEHDLDRRAEAALRAADVPGASVTFDGTRATLHGSFPDAAAVARAKAAVHAVHGTSAVSVGRPAPPPVAAAPAPATTTPAPPPTAAPPTAAATPATPTSTTPPPTTPAPTATPTPTATRTTGTPTPTPTPTGSSPTPTAATPTAAPTTPATPAPVPTATAPTPAPAADLAARLRGAQAGRAITFDLDSTMPTAADRAVLDRVAQVLRTTRGGVRIVGHTDATGSAADNHALSATRAAAVADYLVTHGVHRDRITVAGVGATRPLASESTAAGRAVNRRVDILVA